MNAEKGLPIYYFGDDKDVEEINAESEPITSINNNINKINLGTDNCVVTAGENNYLSASQMNNSGDLIHFSEPNISRIPSPANSIIANTKLEWDSGADIGYNVYETITRSKKGKSFPILSTDCASTSGKINKETNSKTVATKMKDDNENVSNKNFQLATCESPASTSKNSNKKQLPRHSTPYPDKRSRQNTDNSFLIDKNYIENKPILNVNKDECLQTSIINTSCKYVQTDDNYTSDNLSDQKISESINQIEKSDGKSSENNSASGSSGSASFQYISGNNYKPNKNDNMKNISNEENKSSPKSTDKTDLSGSHHSTNTKSSSENNSLLGKVISTKQSKNLIDDIDKSLHLLQKFIKSKNYNTDTKKYYAKKIVSKIIQSKYAEDSSDSGESNLSSVTRANSSQTDKKSDKSQNMPSYTSSKSTENNSKNSDIINSGKTNDEYDSHIHNRDKNSDRSENDNASLDKKSLLKLEQKKARSKKHMINRGIQCDELRTSPVISTCSDRSKVTSNSTVSHSEIISRNSHSKLSDLESHLKLSDQESHPKLISQESRLGTQKSSSTKKDLNAQNIVKNTTDKNTNPVFQHVETSKSWKHEKTLSEKLLEARKKYLSNSEPQTNKTNAAERECFRNTNKDDYLIKYSKQEKKRQLSWINNEIIYLRKLEDLLKNKDLTSDSSTVSTEVQKSINTLTESLNKFSCFQKYETETSKTSSQTQNTSEECPSVQMSSQHTSPVSPQSTQHTLQNKIDGNCVSTENRFFFSHDCHCKISPKNGHLFTGRTRDLYTNNYVIDRFLPHHMHRTGLISHTHDYECVQNLNETPKYDISAKSEDFQLKSVTPNKRDANIQCTLRKKHLKKCTCQESVSPSTVTPISENSNQSVFVLFKNMRSSNNSETSGSNIMKQMKNNRTNSQSDRENKMAKPRKNKSPGTYTHTPNNDENLKPVAYFLTFDEGSTDEYFGRDNNRERKPLETVSVKVPRLNKPNKLKKRSDEINAEYTLQEYLNQNRPEFIKAAEWRRQCVTHITGEKTSNVFTARQIREITLKQYKKLPEVQNKIKYHRTQSQLRQNRLLANVFSKKLQKKTLEGKISLSTSVSVMSAYQ